MSDSIQEGSREDFGNSTEKGYGEECKEVKKAQEINPISMLRKASDNDNDEDDEDDEVDEKSFSISEKQYEVVNGRNFVPCGKTKQHLPTGVYKINASQRHGLFFARQRINVDDLIEFNISLYGELLNQIEDFWSIKDKFKKWGFLHRRGILLYGIQGGGKSSIINIILNKLLDRDGIVFIHSGSIDVFGEGVKLFRALEPDRGIICIFEDIDTIIRKQGEDVILSYLDGEDQVDGVLNVATTNFPELLDKRIVSRPRRFDRLIKVGLPEEGVRKEYFIKKLKIGEEEVKQWVELSKGFTFAAMSELVINVKCFGYDIVESADKINKHMKATPSSEEYDKKGVFGFGKKEDE